MVPIWNNDGDDGNVKKNPLYAFLKLNNKNSYIYYLTKEDNLLIQPTLPHKIPAIAF